MQISKETPIKTPIKSRPYLHSYSALKTPALHDNDNHQDRYRFDHQDQIFGTNISPNLIKTQIQKFIVSFQVVRLIDEQIQTERIYQNQLNDMADQSLSYLFQVDARHIRQYDKQLYLRLIYFPAEIISCFDMVLRDLYSRYFIESETDQKTRDDRNHHKDKIMVDIRHLADSEILSISELSPKNIGRLIAIRGIVLRVSQIYPQMKQACFCCMNPKCKQHLYIDLDNARVQQPQFCANCKHSNTFQLMHNNCKFTDKQYVKFQQIAENVLEGETPSSIKIIAYDSNVDSFRPGDRVEMVGIYRAYAVKINRSKSNLRSVFNTYLDLLSCSILQENRFEMQQHTTLFSDQDRRLFHKIADKKTIIQDLTNSFAPSIFGQKDIKKGILTQLFGGTKKEQGKARFRSDINICLIGDPSTAKSQLLQQVHKIAPRSLYTSGRGSSAVGLTANVRKDPQTHQFILESGALVLSDRGICCIDEFDKMNEDSRTILLQAMEQQTISIAKAGIVCQLNSRTSILAAANPVNSKYDSKKSVMQNINLPPSLLSRFDLIYIMLDIPNEQHDRRLATHILDLYGDKPRLQFKQAIYSMSLLAKYISYAKQYVHPQITQQAGKKLCFQYQQMRKKGLSRHTITATPRQLESLIRMSQAFAKMRLSPQVTEDDVEEAISLMNQATLKSATDPETGLIDMDIITTGKTELLKHKSLQLSQKIRQILEANEYKYIKSTSVEKLLDDFRNIGNYADKTPPTLQQIVQALKLLHAQDLIVLFGPNKYKPQFKLQRISM